MASVPTQIALLTRAPGGADSTCDPDLPTAPWQFDAVPGQPLPLPTYGAGASRQDPAPADSPVQQQIPRSTACSPPRNWTGASVPPRRRSVPG